MNKIIGIIPTDEHQPEATDSGAFHLEVPRATVGEILPEWAATGHDNGIRWWVFQTINDYHLWFPDANYM